MPPVAGPRTVCVLGFHRSGTSLTARILNVLGVDLGDERDLLAPEDSDNPRGYWEPQWMIDLNDELLAHFGGSWWQSFPGAPGWERDPALTPLLERARTLFDEKLGRAPLSGWKDPRTTLTLPFWRQVVPDPLYVICLRNPIDAIASLQRRPEPTRSVQQWGELWFEYTTRALMETRGAPRLVVFYEDFFIDGRAQIERMAAFLDARLTDGDERWDRALPLVEQQLRHHSTSPLELAGIPGVPAGARMLYLALLTAHRLGLGANGDASLAEAIERLAPELWWADVQARRAQVEDARELEVERDAHAATRRELEDIRGAAGTRETKLLERLSVTEEDLRRARQAIADITNSSSWRLTAPLRSLRRG